MCDERVKYLCVYNSTHDIIVSSVRLRRDRERRRPDGKYPRCSLAKNVLIIFFLLLLFRSVVITGGGGGVSRTKNQTLSITDGGRRGRDTERDH